MTADNYHSRPQREEFFVDSGYYKFHEIYHLLRFSNEKQICLLYTSVKELEQEIDKLLK